MRYKANTPLPWETLCGFGRIIYAGYAAAIGHEPARRRPVSRQTRALGSCKGI